MANRYDYSDYFPPLIGQPAGAAKSQTQPSNNPDMRGRDRLSTLNVVQNSKQTNVDLEYGHLIVRTITSPEEQSVPGVTIRVYSEDGPYGVMTYYVVKTDTYGYSPRMALPAPARKYSLQKDGITYPYFTYSIIVIMKGFHTQITRAYRCLRKPTVCMSAG